MSASSGGGQVQRRTDSAMTETDKKLRKARRAHPAKAGRASLSITRPSDRIAERCYPVCLRARLASSAQVRAKAEPGSAHAAWPADRGRPGSIFGMLRALGWRGSLEEVSAGLLVLAAQRGVPVESILAPLADYDLPARGTSERRRLLLDALRRVIWRVASEGRLNHLRRPPVTRTRTSSAPRTRSNKARRH